MNNPITTAQTIISSLVSSANIFEHLINFDHGFCHCVYDIIIPLEAPEGFY